MKPNTVYSLKTAPGAFEIEKTTLLFVPLKSAPALDNISIVFFSFMYSLYRLYVFKTKTYIKNKKNAEKFA